MENSDRYRQYLTVTNVLIAVNVIVFVIEEFAGGSENTEVAVSFGALYAPYVLAGEWWRLVSAMFVHFGMEHLVMNMISLAAIGRYAEEFFGPVRYLILYMLSGIGGNVLTLVSDVHSGAYAVSAGASGAICGLMAVFILFALLPGLRRAFPMRRVLFAIFLILAPGLTDHTISMTAHLGGLITGILTTGVLYLTMRHRS
ncbi:MAG: rhomboid family intramembrane serine protease [Lachnospiraceae bacterium]|nr:rhomboid family intramembrane serine protease [Lachnospiraceae bacterium]